VYVKKWNIIETKDSIGHWRKKTRLIQWNLTFTGIDVYSAILSSKYVFGENVLVKWSVKQYAVETISIFSNFDLDLHDLR